MGSALSVIMFTFLVVNGEKPEAKTDTHKRDAPTTVEKSGNASLPVASTPQQTAPQKQCDDHAQQPPSYLSRLFSPENLPNIALVIVGSFTFWAIWKQVEETAKATGAMRSSTDAMISGLRAWLTVDIDWQRENGGLMHGDGEEGQTTSVFVNYICMNAGKSFGQIIDKGYVMKMAIPPLPPEPDFSGIDVFHQTAEYIGPDDTARPYPLSITCQGRHNPNNIMVLYGRVRYRDVYGEHETRFGYLITPNRNLDRLSISSYPEYNKYT